MPMGFRFKLLDEAGTDLGPFVSSEPNWHAGHQVHRGAGDVLEVVRFVDADEADDVTGYLIVRPI